MSRTLESRFPTDRWRTVLLAVLLATLVAAAGCSGLAGSDGGSPAPTTEAPQPTTDAPAATTSDEPTDGSTDVSGQMTIMVSDTQFTEPAESDSFEYEPSAKHRWNASEGTTLAEALSTLDVEAGEDELTYDGETYDGSENGTYVSYRVNGEPVNPTEYTLEQDDEVWVDVHTPETERSVPGEYIDDSDQHMHGHLEVVVEGETVDFGSGEYYSNDDYFHYHDGEPESWHAHSRNLTLQYALSTFTGMDATDDSFTYDGTTYEADDPETTIRYEVNGQPVTPSDYYIKDWDGIRVVVETDS